MATYKVIHTLLYAVNFLLSENIDSKEKEEVKQQIENLLDTYEDLSYAIKKLE